MSVTVSVSRKEFSSKVEVSNKEKNPFPIAGMNDSLKNTFLLDG